MKTTVIATCAVATAAVGLAAAGRGLREIPAMSRPQ